MAHYVAQFLWVYLSKVMRTYDSTVGGMLIPTRRVYIYKKWLINLNAGMNLAEELHVLIENKIVSRRQNLFVSLRINPWEEMQKK